jgi:MYXO-CTERM domain-containing protein
VGSNVDAETCDGAGNCVSTTVVAACDPFECANGVCTMTCAMDGDCAADAYCSNGQCVKKVGGGTACTAADQCSTGFCVDGVCCNQACGAECEACDTLAALGTCVPVTGAPHGGRSACPMGTNACATLQCDGVQPAMCAGSAPVMAGTSCGASTCNGTIVEGAVCDGAGSCAMNPTGMDCDPFLCKSGSCTSACGSDVDCAPDAYCSGGKCVKKETNAQKCTAADECTSGFCVDGYCCNSPCSGQCEACDVPQGEGTCLPVTGGPHGSRSTCPTGDGDVCTATRCDGSTRDMCAGYVNAQTQCRAGSCTNGVATSASNCDGKGHCPDPIIAKCGNFLCGGNTCKTSCATSADCAMGNTCDPTGKCVSAATCDGDHTTTSANGTSQDCSPYKCSSDGNCKQACVSVNDCVAPTVCDPTGHCVEPSQAPSGDSSGCAAAPGGSGGSADAWWVAIGALVIAVGARRRKHRSRRT